MKHHSFAVSVTDLHHPGLVRSLFICEIEVYPHLCQ